MKISLRLRFLLATMAIAGATLTAIALFSSRVTLSEIERVTSPSPAAAPRLDLDTLRGALTDYWNRHHRWTSVELTLHRLAGESAGLLLLSDQTAPIASWPPELAQSRVTLHPDQSLELDGRTAAGETRRMVLRGSPRIALPGGTTLYLLPVESPTAESRSEITRTVNRSLLLAVLLAFTAALIAALLLSRYILRPVRALTTAAGEIAEGRFDRRVPTHGRDEIGRLADTFNTMADRLAHTEQLRRNMVGDISHELRTPLTRMQCQVEAIQDGLAPSTPEALHQLHDQILQLDRLVDDLQDLSLSDAGQLKLTPVPVRLDILIREVATGRPISLEIAPDLPPVLADQRRLRQILENLIAALRRPGEIEVRVQDRGPGIPAEHLARIFERFHRVDDSRTRSTGGTGLGLAIVKHLVEAHGGHVRAEGSPGTGATLIFTLPTLA
uniref:Signal transduction histidine-protein kinase/phosphatase MprB n=1 Tax=Solibacter usitatus (strain Ellin6076) TaxID=234267 RepID=Q01WH7_SOLUE